MLQRPNSLLWGKLSLEVKRPGYESNHSSPSVARVKRDWSCIFVPPYASMAWCLSQHGLVTFYRYLPPGFPKWQSPLFLTIAHFLSSAKCVLRSPSISHSLILVIKKDNTIPLQIWTGPEGSRRLRLPDFKTVGT